MAQIQCDEAQNKHQQKHGLLYSKEESAISALCLAMQVDRGRLAYDDLVVKHWPEYGQNGKQTTAVERLLTHQVNQAIQF
ncbi:unnamed protein product [Gongylonema pulchrum]|uniref:Beta-lactamase domain-containing protein n=1 Tax=Gongylonema pulchrum TaxID=637853 RepID=A0A183F029_9BILA|nr:unnamed protein product [Gongylonema pulchrum]